MQAISRTAVSSGSYKQVKIDQLRKPVLRLGSTHPDVTELQSLLSLYVTQPPLASSIFNTRTDYAVRVFQYRMFLAEDGVVGPQTWFSLYTGAPVKQPVLTAGSSGPAVKLLQEVLNVFGMQTSTDGAFGRYTERVVKDFQRYMGLTVDAVVGAETWHALSKIRLEDPTTPITQVELATNRQAHYEKVTDLSVSAPDVDASDRIGARIATASLDTTVRLWSNGGHPIEPAYLGDK